jgi:hypothetical protein
MPRGSWLHRAARGTPEMLHQNAGDLKSRPPGACRGSGRGELGAGGVRVRPGRRGRCSGVGSCLPGGGAGGNETEGAALRHHVPSPPTESAVSPEPLKFRARTAPFSRPEPGEESVSARGEVVKNFVKRLQLRRTEFMRPQRQPVSSRQCRKCLTHSCRVEMALTVNSRSAPGRQFACVNRAGRAGNPSDVFEAGDIRII